MNREISVTNDIPINLNSQLSREVLSSYRKLYDIISNASQELFFEKKFKFTAIDASIADIIAYQIGWGSLFKYWYETGIKNKPVIMPGNGFDKWDYNAIARHFYKKYSWNSKQEYIDNFSIIVMKIIDITELEYVSDNLDKTGVFAWCKLKSGKDWPLSKWIKVNTVAPYKRALLLIKNASPSNYI